MATVSLEGINKVYENGFHAVKDLSVDIADGEFMVLVGRPAAARPPRCGWWPGWRTSPAACCASAGRRQRRDTQGAGHRHGLPELRPVPAHDGGGEHRLRAQAAQAAQGPAHAKVKEAADILGLTDWLDRKPGQLSGGQRQRVAMGRAIVREPRCS